jgi:hypothetical protein
MKKSRAKLKESEEMSRKGENEYNRCVSYCNREKKDNLYDKSR